MQQTTSAKTVFKKNCVTFESLFFHFAFVRFDFFPFFFCIFVFIRFFCYSNLTLCIFFFSIFSLTCVFPLRFVVFYPKVVPQHIKLNEWASAEIISAYNDTKVLSFAYKNSHIFSFCTSCEWFFSFWCKYVSVGECVL